MLTMKQTANCIISNVLALTDLSGYETILQFTPSDLNVLIVISF